LDDFNYYFNDDILYLFHKGQYWIYNFQSGNNISIIHDYYPSSEINSWYLMKNQCGATARNT
jgi:hypothetical protein